MKVIPLIIIALTVTSICKAQQPNRKVWTKEVESELYNAIYKVGDTLFKTKDQRIDYANYCVRKIEERLPNGIDSVPDDSLKKIFYEVGESYSFQSKTLIFKQWTPEYEKVIKHELFDSPPLKVFNEKDRQTYCDCYVEQLKEMYPNGITKMVPKDVKIKLSRICYKQLKNIDSLKK